MLSVYILNDTTAWWVHYADCSNQIPLILWNLIFQDTPFFTEVVYPMKPSDRPGFFFATAAAVLVAKPYKRNQREE